MVAAPLPWFGGKRRLAPWIIPHFPAHTTYVEVFGGSAAVLFAKPPSALEIYNDLDSELVHFFRVLRDPVLAAELAVRLAWTPYSREEWRSCLTQLQGEEEAEPVERARRWFVAVAQSFSSNVTAGSWRHSVGPGGHAARAFRHAAERLMQLRGRLAQVQIEHLDFAQVVAVYDAPHTLFYCDPPYVPTTRRQGRYRHELTLADHERLVDLLLGCQGQVVVSGYASALYQQRLGQWTRYQREVPCPAAGHTRETGLQGRDGAGDQRRVECLWVKPAVRGYSLWEAT